MRTTLLALAVLVLATSGAAPASPQRARLGDEVVPLAYDLTVAPNVATMRTAGSETLDVRVRRPVSALVLNGRALRVSRAAIDGRPARVELLPAIDQLRLSNGSALTPGRHRVTLRFTGAISGTSPAGLFYDVGAPNVVSLFEPSSARTVFPCFDEPAFRASFTLHVRAPPAWTVISNMPLEAKSTAGGDGLVQSDFSPSPPMSAYQLTIDAGVFAAVAGVAGTVPIRVFVQPGREAQARTMLADAERLLPFYARLFGRSFPLPKLDFVVVPGALQTAFEGWGAITFYNEDEPFGAQFGGGERGRRLAAEMVAHEIAHQWAGDLVTMRWWRDTFVAEALAQFSERAAMTALFPELQPWRDEDRDVWSIMSRGVRPGSRAAIQPILTDLDRDDMVVFNQATYDKGAAAIGGWRDAVGEPVFRAGLQRYIGRFAGGSATFEQFWDALGGADGVAYGRSWLVQRGFPVIDVRTSCRGGRRSVTVAQTPFVSDPLIDAGYRAQRWIVPIVIRDGTQERRIVLRTARASVEFAACGTLEVSPGRRPYFVVRYDDAEYAALAARAAALAPRDRDRLYRDATLLHSAGALADEPYRALTNALGAPER